MESENTENSVRNEDVREDFVKKYSDILKKSKNIIFHGAPGTGKTYLAKQIAANIVSDGTVEKYDDLTEEQKKQIEFVQFHPSYDYTDFVEGLRPIVSDDGTMGFELTDGVFKSFVDKARDESNNKKIQGFLTIAMKKKPKLKTRKSSFEVVDYNDAYINTNWNDLKIDKIEKLLSAEMTFTDSNEIRQYLDLPDSNGDCYYAVYNEIIKYRNQYVFIIDEINRGEISKIFGELFFAIDPCYRGVAGSVSTQYQNMHENTNIEFYVPDNVYIIGTMNDIDRSVDSFDFAMRRRFRFINVKANEHTDMLDVLGDKKEDAIKRMTALNEAIASTEGLNENYQIGAAYFLKLNDCSYEELWNDYLEPLIQEYLQGMWNEKEALKNLKDAYDLKSAKNEVSNN